MACRALTVSDLLDPEPTEIRVFIPSPWRGPLFVVTGGRLRAGEGPEIAGIGRTTDARK
jgi:hypothetical protein